MANSNQDNQDGNNQDGEQGDTSNRGFASMHPERQHEIAAEGGGDGGGSGSSRARGAVRRNGMPKQVVKATTTTATK